MIRKFVNREFELSFFKDIYKEDGFKFLAIYGRRRIGKSELIKEFLKDKSHIYMLCDKKGTEDNIYRLKQKISELLNEPVIETNDLEEIFAYLAKKKDGLVLVFDEYPYLAEKDDSIPSQFQRAIDEALKKTNAMLILCGSSIAMMEKGVLSQKSPLYGRKTHHIKIEEFKLGVLLDFFPKITFEKAIEFYAMAGGVPFYLEKLEQSLSAEENAMKEILNKKGKLFEETDFLLKTEFREPDTYKKILEKIAGGASRVVDIANKSGINSNDLDKYLKLLMSLGIIRKETPVTESRKSKKSTYSINDNFFDFWFTFAEKFKSELNMDEHENLNKYLKNNWNSFVGKKFEKIIGKQIMQLFFSTAKIGNWHGHYRDKEGKRQEIEMDAIAINEDRKEITFAECKWQDQVNPEKIILELNRKAGYVNWHNSTRKESYAVFAKSFSKKIKEFQGKKVYCYDLKDLEKASTSRN